MRHRERRVVDVTSGANRFTELIGCRYPIQLAAMSGIASAHLAAAVSDGGGLGMFGVGSRRAHAVAAAIDEIESLTSRVVGAGFIVEFLDRDVLELATARLPVIEFFWGWPDASIVPADRIVGWQVGSVDEARAAADAGCAYVVAQGLEAGGHVRSTDTLDRLLPSIAQAIGDDVVVVAAGGIGSHADVSAAMSLGAEAVRVGSRFVATHESAAHDRYVELLVASSGSDTELSEAFWVGWPDAQHRVLTSAVEASGDGDDVVGHMPGPNGTTNVVPRFFVSPPTRDFSGDIDAMALYAGTAIDAITCRISADEVIADLMQGWG